MRSTADRVYAFEDKLLADLRARGVLPAGDIEWPDAVATLRSFWATYAPPGAMEPLLSYALRGQMYKGKVVYKRGVSYSVLRENGDVIIALVRGQRNEIVLLHEIAHCMGHWNHGARFVARYLSLLCGLGLSAKELTARAELNALPGF